MIILDTDVCSYLMRRARRVHPEVLETTLDLGEASVSAVTRAELRYGAALAGPASETQGAVATLLATVSTLAWDERAADRYGDLRAELRRRGEPIGVHDEMIAAHALVLGATLLTNNVRHFARVPGLDIRPWEPAA